MTKITIEEFRTDTIRISTHRTALPKNIFEKMSNDFSTDTTFEATIENYPIVFFGKHIVYVSFTLYGVEWMEDGDYGCSLSIPEEFSQMTSIKSPNLGYIDLEDVENYIITEAYKGIKQIVYYETLNTRVYEVLADTFSRTERDSRGFA